MRERAAAAVGRLLSAAGMLLLFLSSVSALAESTQVRDQPLKHMQHTRWTQKDGLPGVVMAIVRGTDGYLWVGTGAGLFRFDGLRFERFESIAGDALPSQGVLSLHAVKDRGLWVGLIAGGTVFVRDGRVETVDLAEGPLASATRGFAVDRDGTLWMSSGRALLKRENERWISSGEESGLPKQQGERPRLKDLVADGDGNLWAVMDRLYVRPAGAAKFQPYPLQASGAAMQIMVDPQGRVWVTGDDRVGAIPLVGGDRYKLVYRLPRWGHGSVAPPQAWPVPIGYFAPMLDRRGLIWYAGRHGLIRDHITASTDAERSAGFENMRVEDGLSGDRVLKAYEDPDGSVWVGTTGGLDRFRASAINPVEFPQEPAHISMAINGDGSLWISSFSQKLLTVPLGSPRAATAELEEAPVVNRLFFDSKRRLWQGGNEGFWVQDSRRIREVPVQGNYPWVGAILDMAEDGAGDIWASTARVWLLRMRDGVWVSMNGTQGIPDRRPSVLSTDARRRLVAGYLDGSLAVMEGERAQVIKSSDGLRVGAIKAIEANASHLWIAGDTGVQDVMAPGRPLLQTTDATATSDVTGIVQTPQGDLWLNGSSGITYVPAEEVQRALSLPGHRMAFRRIDSLDGLNGRAEQSFPLKTAARTSDGRLWFSLNNGVVTVDPARVVARAAPLNALIQRATLGGERIPLDGLSTLALPAGSRQIQIDYTAPLAAIPERVRFRYRLQGLDGEWQEAGARRQAFYTNLEPGDYRFEVQAAVDDRWDGPSAELSLQIPPTLTESWWFRGGCVVLALLVLAGYVALRLKEVATREQERLLIRATERERVAQDLHDTLLQGVMGLILRFQVEADRLPQAEATGLQRVIDEADALWKEGRNRVKDLRETLPAVRRLEDVLRALGESQAQGRVTRFSLTVVGPSRPLNPDVAAELLLIAREALFNAFNHAGAPLISVDVLYGERAFGMAIIDNGRGIPHEVLAAGGKPGHWGLGGMRRRGKAAGAEVQIISGPEGTTVNIQVAGRRAYDAEARPSAGGVPRSWWRRDLPAVDIGRMNRGPTSGRRTPDVLAGEDAAL